MQLLRLSVALSLSAIAVHAQAPSSKPASTPKPPASSVVASAPAPPAASTPLSSPSVSLHATNPTAIPLASIVSNPPTQATVPLSSPATAGATPPISGAPPLPSFVFQPGVYPALDIVPPIDSPQVKQWIQQVQSSGVQIPNIPPTVAGGCPTNQGAAANGTASGTCWWTCGGCTRATDVTTCPDKLTWGLSFDDGPSPYSSDLVNYLASKNLKSTFFIVGSRAISRPDILQAEYMAGHQLSAHTWSHPSLTTLSNEQIIAELGWTMKAIKDITGVTPNTMRPPYGDIDDRVRAICKAMGLTPIIWTSVGQQTFDTEDWHIAAGTVSAQQVLAQFDNILNLAPTLNTGFIVLSHDLYQQSVDLAIGYYLPDALARQPPFTLKPIVSCLNKPLGDAYIETNNNQTNPPSNGASTLSPTATGGSGSGSGSGGSKNGAVALSSTGGLAGIFVSLIGAFLGAGLVA